MKLKLAEIKKALAWIEANSQDSIINLEIDDNRESFLKIKCQDRLGTFVEIKVFGDGNMLPKILKETNLP